MIDETEIERAVNWLAKAAEKAAAAAANRRYMEEYRKTLKSQLMAERVDSPLSAQERDAYADARYVEHLDALREAVQVDEKFRWLRVAAETKISVWQSQTRAARV
jgi:hypothetical protein